MKGRCLLVFLLAFVVPAAHAHVGSKDVFETVDAGPYKLYVTIRPPNVIPGVATVEIRTAGGAGVTDLKIAPVPLVGEAARHPPTPDTLVRSTSDPNFFTGGVWIMAAGSWQVKIQVEGAAGPQNTSVPVLAVPVATLKMQRGMGLALATLGLFLVLSMVGLIGAAFREGMLAPGAKPSTSLRRRGLIASAVGLVVMAAAVYLGGLWWDVEAASYARNIYTRPLTQVSLQGDQFDLTVKPFHGASSRTGRSNDDFLPDHGHLIHLYAIREPQMDAVFHMHPVRVAPGDFRMNLPAMPAGHYQLYGDVVHANGFPETLTATLDVPANLPAAPLGAEDAEALPAPLSQGPLGNAYKLPDGYTMIWDRPGSLTAGTAYSFHFRLVDPAGKPATDMQPYLGMAGHAAFVKTDGTVFAHTHPEGSVAMAALALAEGGDTMPAMGGMTGMSMADSKPLPPAVDFPYGFPSPGAYRIFIQMTHGTTVETGVFDARVQ
jgi:hypothetical protein